jgi:hypothetical protein
VDTPWQLFMIRSAMTVTALLWAPATHAGDDEITQSAKTAVVAKLVHPDSARFTDVRVIDKNGQKVVCGHVGATNRKGEYDAAKPFVFLANEQNAKHSVIIYGGRSITNDRFSNFAQPTAFIDLCGS